MDQVAPRAPLLGRLSPGAWQALTWGGAALFAALLFVTLARSPAPLFAPPHTFLRLSRWTLLIVAIVVAAPMGLARRRPLPVAAILLAESLFAALLREREWPLLLAADVLVCYLAATRARRLSIPFALVTLAAGAAESAPDLVLAAAKNGLLLFPTVVAWLAGNSVRQRRDYAAALRAQVAAQAVTDERLRIARELHDVVAHSIGVIAIQAGVGNRVIDTQPAEARNALGAIETTARDTLFGLRRMLGGLRTAEPGPGFGLSDVDKLVATVAEAGVRVDVHWIGPRGPLAPEVELSAFRIIQESLTNVLRHAQAGRCRVCIDYRDEELAVEITDDGHANTPTGEGYGIAGMRERVDLLHGSFAAGPAPDGGFRVRARLPR